MNNRTNLRGFRNLEGLGRTDMTIEKLRPTFTFDQERLDALKAIAPEAFADGKINWETLREALGEHLEDEDRDAEHFGLFWPGKRDARRLASTPSAGTLKPAPGEGVNEATTRHVFIEGDNLEVLKLLQKSYAGRVKMIYIDPPYNTGNDFIYSDNFTQPLEEYLRATGQADDMGPAGDEHAGRWALPLELAEHDVPAAAVGAESAAG